MPTQGGTSKSRFRNRLAGSKSPYLLQHADNPVDWRPWDEEALAQARAENKPILLSVGYSACHWCHVMERESFRDEEIAALMNEHFVNIKVDREERPDLDHLYQMAAQLLTGQGGWPLTVFLMPDLRPFYAGTYFPPVDRYGRPGFRRVLETIQKAWASGDLRMEAAADRLAKAIGQFMAGTGAKAAQAGLEHVEAVAESYLHRFDDGHGGFGEAPKFPNAEAIELLLAHGARAGSSEAMEAALTTLRRMAEGGLYDQLGGGFHRYATDREWLVPHFEKMLYDNASLAPLYLDAWRLTGESVYERTARGVLQYLLREMRSPEGGFFSSQDADSEGEEGKHFVWDPAEFKEALGEADGELLAAHLGVTPAGNFEGGKSVLHVAASPAELAERFGLSEEECAARLAAGKAKLLEHRSKRKPPGRDEKIITAWNGLAVSAFARAGQILGEPAYTEAARQAAGFLRERLVDSNGRLLRSYKDGPGDAQGFLEDYALLAQGLFDLYEASWEEEWLLWAQELVSQALDLFAAEEGAGFFMTAKDAEALLHRPRDLRDQSMPSGTAILLRCLVRLESLEHDAQRRRLVDRALGALAPEMKAQPWGLAASATAMLWALDGGVEVGLAAPPGAGPEDPGIKPIVEAIHSVYAPCRVLWVGGEGRRATAPFFEGRGLVEGRPAVYICRRQTCSPPLTDPQEAAALLREA